jgi:hypothetical protein
MKVEQSARRHQLADDLRLLAAAAVIIQTTIELVGELIYLRAIPAPHLAGATQVTEHSDRLILMGVSRLAARECHAN